MGHSPVPWGHCWIPNNSCAWDCPAAVPALVPAPSGRACPKAFVSKEAALSCCCPTGEVWGARGSSPRPVGIAACFGRGMCSGALTLGLLRGDDHRLEISLVGRFTLKLKTREVWLWIHVDFTANPQFLPCPAFSQAEFLGVTGLHSELSCALGIPRKCGATTKSEPGTTQSVSMDTNKPTQQACATANPSFHTRH